MLAPNQLGVGAKGGAEAVIHAARLYLQNMDADRAFVKVDFSNAFNSVRRDVILEAVAFHRPDLLGFATSAYGSSSQLWAGDVCLSSSEGVQQGDPLGPLLFSLALDDTLKTTRSEFMAGYLDDISIGDTVPRLIDQVRGLEAAALAVGLRLNHAKCEIIGLSASCLETWNAAGFMFAVRPIEEASLLGSPIHIAGVDDAITVRLDQLVEIVERLQKMSAHEAFFLLKSCFAMPRLIYLLRSAPCSPSNVLAQIGEVVIRTLANVRFQPEAWSQSSLPVRWGV